MTQWQPIETAPKDGTEILVCVTHDTSEEGRETVQWVDWARDTNLWPIYRARIDIPFPPTHWMPLPDPPCDTDRSPEGQDGETGLAGTARAGAEGIAPKEAS